MNSIAVQSLSMRTVATHILIAWSVCLSVDHDREPTRKTQPTEVLFAV